MIYRKYIELHCNLNKVIRKLIGYKENRKNQVKGELVSKGKILKLPSKMIAQKSKSSELSVNCELTYRWLRFSKTYSDSENRKVALVDIMTTNVEGIDRKICGLAISVDELLKVIKKIHDNEQ